MALAIYISTVLVSVMLWYVFSPKSILKDLPDTICHYQGKYFLSRTNTGKHRFAGNLNSIRLTFKEYLQNSVLKNLARIEVYEADKIEADLKITNLVLLVDTRTEDTYKVLVSKLIKAKAGLIISF